MIRSLSILLLVLLTLSCKKMPVPTHKPTANEGYLSPLAYDGWKLVWQDEFKATKLDATKWNIEVNDWGGGNEEAQYYTERPENVRLTDGKLVITARKEKYLSRDYTSARITTKGKGDWKYGRLDIRAKLPKGSGLWPAIWMLPTANQYGAWHAGGELDIMELVGKQPRQIHCAAHFGSDTPATRKSNTGTYHLPKGDFSSQFHVFSMEWEPTEIRWYIDNKIYHALKASKPFDERYHLILNLAIGGNWPGYPKANAVFPKHLYVDYVRVFGRKPATTAEAQ